MDRTIALIDQSHRGDKRAKERLVKENAGLVWCIVKRFCKRGADPEDLFQIGSIGLLKAIDKFDLSYEVKFSTYAVPMISGEIRRFLRDDGMIKVSRSLKELAYKGRRGQEELRRARGKEPTLGEIAAYIQAEPEELAEAMESGNEVESIHRPIYQKEGQEISLLDKLGSQESPEQEVVDHILLAELLGNLNQEERRLIGLRYFANQTQSEVGKAMGISQVQVSRMEKKILRRLREGCES